LIDILACISTYYVSFQISLNFTESGTKYNYETRIRVTDREAVGKIEEEFEALYDQPDLAFFGIEGWGRLIYAKK